MIEQISLPISKPCKFIYDYWLSKCSDGYKPTRKDINPKDIKHILPYISMIDVIEHGKDYRVRLIGSEVERYIGRDCTNEFLSMDMGFERSLYEPWFRCIVSDKKALLGTINSSGRVVELTYDREIISIPLMNEEQSEVAVILSVIVRTNHWSKHISEFENTASETFHKN